jgi:hypothetical protein
MVESPLGWVQLPAWLLSFGCAVYSFRSFTRSCLTGWPSSDEGMTVARRCPESNCQHVCFHHRGTVARLKISSRLAGAIKLPFRKINSVLCEQVWRDPHIGVKARRMGRAKRNPSVSRGEK